MDIKEDTDKSMKKNALYALSKGTSQAEAMSNGKKASPYP